MEHGSTASLDKIKIHHLFIINQAHHRLTCEHCDNNWPHAALALDFTDFGTRFFDLFSSTAALDFSPAVISYKIRKRTFFFQQQK